MQKRKVKGMPVIECNFFFLSRYLKTVQVAINLYLLSFFVAPPIAISVLAQCEQSSFIVLFCLALSAERKK